MYVDYQDNVWVGFGGGLPYDLTTRATTDNAHVLKFTPDGEFLLQIGEFGGGTEGNNSTQFLGQPTDVYVDPETDEAYVTDGHTNRRVIVFDANTGEYKRHWGAYGNEPDDAATIGFDRNGPPPQQFNTPHCIGMANDGLLYVCDRQHERIQVFEKDGTFVKEAAVTVMTSDGEVGGRPDDLAFSLDPEQRLVYMVDMANAKVHTLERDSLRNRGHVRSTWTRGRSAPDAPQLGAGLGGESLRHGNHGRQPDAKVCADGDELTARDKSPLNPKVASASERRFPPRALRGHRPHRRGRDGAGLAGC